VIKSHSGMINYVISVGFQRSSKSNSWSKWSWEKNWNGNFKVWKV